KPLVGALLKVVRGPAWGELDVAAAIGGPELLDLRLAQLESGQEPKMAALTRTGAGLFLLGAVAFAGAFIASIAGFGGASAVSQATGTTMSFADVLGGVMCALPFAVGGLALYRWLASRARRPLTRPPQATTVA